MKVHIFSRMKMKLIILVLSAGCLAFVLKPPGLSLNIDNQTFDGGEFLKFRVHYGFITAGFATLEVMDTLTPVRGTMCHHVIGKGFTHPGFDWVYKVRDQYETFMEPQSLLSMRFNRHIREGGFEHYSETHFHHESQKALYIDHKKREYNFDVPVGIQDVISAFYHARAAHDADTLKVDDRISLRNFLDRKTFNLEARMLGREEIKVDGKRYKALKFDLLIEEAGLITDGSSIQFWISDDGNKVPLRIESDLMIGALKADLIEWSGLKHPFTSQIKKD